MTDRQNYIKIPFEISFVKYPAKNSASSFLSPLSTHVQTTRHTTVSEKLPLWHGLLEVSFPSFNWHLFCLLFPFLLFYQTA